ncbi:MAG: hypothetical protein LV473_18215 [Nitrospira sp.]|nr:hypothetical protein [Nitrospira sp.]
MSIAVFIDTPELKRDLAIELAVTLAEFSIEENEPLYLLADAVTALEVGMSLIGSRESRTVEGGEYYVSPIQLLPFIPHQDLKDDEALRGTSESDAGGELSELYALGLFARRDERAAGWDLGIEPAVALSQVIATVRPKHVVGLGDSSVYWTAISDGIQRSTPEYVPQIVMIEGFGSERVEGRYERILVRRPDFTPVQRTEREFSREGDELEELRLAAERDGALVAGFLDFLVNSVRGR